MFSAIHDDVAVLVRYNKSNASIPLVLSKIFPKSSYIIKTLI